MSQTAMQTPRNADSLGGNCRTSVQAGRRAVGGVQRHPRWRRLPQAVRRTARKARGHSSFRPSFRWSTGRLELRLAAIESPNTIIQAALKAATFDLPIDPGLGYAYIMPFNNNSKQPDGSWLKKHEATFILGYKGMIQLAQRTGAYRKINVIDVRQGELKSYDRLTEDIELEFVQDEDEREKLPVIGWVGYFRLMNGAEKTIFMTRRQVEAHEKKFRKGQNMTKGWREDFDAMAAKTVLRRLIGKWGLMSIEYQRGDAATLEAATAIADGQYDDLPPLEGELTDPPAES